MTFTADELNTLIKCIIESEFEKLRTIKENREIISKSEEGSFSETFLANEIRHLTEELNEIKKLKIKLNIL